MDEYDYAIESVEKIILSMDSAVKEMWSAGYTGMMVSVGRVFAGEESKKSLAEDIPSVLKEISEIFPGMEYEFEDGKIIVKKCIVRDLANKGVTEMGGPLCMFMKGFLMKMIETVEGTQRKLDIKMGELCEITLR
jgi:predicted hydrocarbon binding protein